MPVASSTTGLLDATPGARFRCAGWTHGGGLAVGEAVSGDGEDGAAELDAHAPRTHTAARSSAAPLVTVGLFQQLRRAQLHLVDAALQERGAHEIPEQRVRAVRARAELRMELARHEPWMPGQLDDLDQAAGRRHAAEHHARVSKHLAVLVVELEAVAVPLVHDLLAVSPVRKGARHELARGEAESHRS